MSEYIEELVGVTEYGEGHPVTLEKREDGRLVVCALNECGNNGTSIDFVQLLDWVKINKPGFLKP